MLVLSRKQDEKILMKVPGAEKEIEITVKKINGSRVKLGFSAPENVIIVRNELLGPNQELTSFSNR